MELEATILSAKSGNCRLNHSTIHTIHLVRKLSIYRKKAAADQY